MSILRKYLPAVFGRASDVAKVNDNQPATDIGPVMKTNELPAPIDLDAEQAAKFHNVLLFLVPTEEMAMTAFDDYYPGFYFALRQFENAVHAGFSPEHYNKAPYSNYENLPAAYTGPDIAIVGQFEELRTRMSDAISFHRDASGAMVPTGLDHDAFMSAVYDNLGLLQATKAMLETPIKHIKLYEGRAIVSEDEPLKADLAQNTRYGRAYHSDFLEEFLGFIDWAAANEPKPMREITLSTPQLPEA